ncbi:MAG: hypothetical protein ABIO35_12410 [Nitrobacter sp.]
MAEMLSVSETSSLLRSISFFGKKRLGSMSVSFREYFFSPSSLGDQQASLLLPIWLQKDWGDISMFGGGGCQFTVAGESKSFCLYGTTVTRQVLPKLQLGVELFHQTTDFAGAHPTTTLGVGARYDVDKNYHRMGYVAHDLRDLSASAGLYWYASILFTF